MAFFTFSLCVESPTASFAAGTCCCCCCCCCTSGALSAKTCSCRRTCGPWPKSTKTKNCSVSAQVLQGRHILLQLLQTNSTSEANFSGNCTHTFCQTAVAWGRRKGNGKAFFSSSWWSFLTLTQFGSFGEAQFKKGKSFKMKLSRKSGVRLWKMVFFNEVLKGKAVPGGFVLKGWNHCECGWGSESDV